MQPFNTCHAALDGIPYNDYLKLFFEACDQPWSAIQKANAHLIGKLEQANSVHIIDEDTGTNLTLKIEGKRWANSLVLKNIPGSEVFASPIKDSVNGKLVAKGKFQYGNSGIIEDITLEFKDGRVVGFDAAKGRDALAKIIEADDGKGEGSRFVGEFAMGTNPWLKDHLVNGLLVEKISSSFHIALGESYHYNEYDGKQVALDNKNTSASGTHWDITTMMKGEKSRIVLDEGTPQEYTVMRKGKFIDPALQVLNDGWGALEEKPAYWQERLGSRTGRAATV
jgi:aminopeptidase